MCDRPCPLFSRNALQAMCAEGTGLRVSYQEEAPGDPGPWRADWRARSLGFSGGADVTPQEAPREGDDEGGDVLNLALGASVGAMLDCNDLPSLPAANDMPEVSWNGQWVDEIDMAHMSRGIAQEYLMSITALESLHVSRNYNPSFSSMNWMSADEDGRWDIQLDPLFNPVVLGSALRSSSIPNGLQTIHDGGAIWGSGSDRTRHLAQEMSSIRSERGIARHSEGTRPFPTEHQAHVRITV